MELKSLWKKLIEIRGITQLELSKKLGVGRPYLTKKINSKSMTTDSMFEILNELDFDIKIIDKKTGKEV